MLGLGARLLQFLVSRVDTGLDENAAAARAVPQDVAPEAGLVRGGHVTELAADPLRRRVGHADGRLVVGVQQVDRVGAGLVGQVHLGRRAADRHAHAARLVDHDHQGQAGQVLLAIQVQIDRQRLLDRRVDVAAGSQAHLAADHDQAAAQFLDVILKQLHLAAAHRAGRNVAQDHAVVGGELLDRLRHVSHRPGFEGEAALVASGPGL